MINFFKKIKNSIYGPAFYQDLLSRPLSFSFKYYYSLVFLLTVIFTISFSISAVPAVNEFLKSAGPIISETFPNDLEVTIQKGKASTNAAEPCFIKMPAEWKGSTRINGEKTEKITNILVIDTKNDFNLDQFYKYETVFLLTRDAMVYLDRNKVSMNSLKGIGSLKINHAVLMGWVNLISPYFVIAGPVVVCAIFVGIFLWLGLLKLIYLLFLTVLIWIAAKIKKVSIEYWGAYKCGLHLMTLSLIVECGSYVSPLSIIRFPFLFTVLAVVLAFVNLRKVPEISIEAGTSSPDGTAKN